MPVPFRDRIDAGRTLARKLAHYGDQPNVIVLALPRGGVPVGFEVAAELGAPLDVFLVRKLGVPGREELALGAIATGGVVVVNHDVLRITGIDEPALDALAERAQQELQRRERAYRGDKPPPNVEGCTVILVDDGLATGATMLAAARAVRRLNPARVVVAAPVAASQVCDAFRSEVDEIVCAETPRPFDAVGLWYEDFSQTTDDEVKNLLARAAERVHLTD